MASTEDLHAFYEDARALASKAVAEDSSGADPAVALTFYKEAIEAFIRIRTVEPDESKRRAVDDACSKYMKRAEALKSTNLPTSADWTQPVLLTEVDALLQQGDFFLQQAGVESESARVKNAIEQYTTAAEIYFKALKASANPAQKERIRKTLEQALTSSEELKKSSSAKPNDKAAAAKTSTAVLLTDEEKAILAGSSSVNGHVYLPWNDDKDLNERFLPNELFQDPDGLLPLSEKQKLKLGGWKRPGQVMTNPKMIQVISANSLVQDVVTDCSFVASLCVASSYERRKNRRLITSTIWPQNSKQEPMYNPGGKYLIKLHYNGCQRRVVVDDLLPVSKSGALMCTYSRNRNEIWSSIVEKAYMKLMGGYDFPGSNSGIDLHALTGWIPEHLFVKDTNFNIESTWYRMCDGHKFGDSLITIATGDLKDEEAESLGLVPTHAYAVLDICEIGGQRLMQVKNPWSHKRWVPPIGEEINWTPELKRALNYDQLADLQKDDGIFWIRYSSVLKHFDSIHMNWNPELFRVRDVRHITWPMDDGPRKDNYNLGNNPQFGLETNVSNEKETAVWLLLTKHITVKEENKDYIALHVYEKTNCDRVYYPENPMIQGVYINSPHILVRFNAPLGKTRYTIVISQHEKKKSLSFTLRTYSMFPFKIGPVQKRFPVETKIPGAWTSDTSGGCMAFATFYRNPQYYLRIDPGSAKKSGLFIMLEAPRTFAVNVRLVQSGKRVSNVSSSESVASSGDYRHGFCYFNVIGIQPGEYTVIVSTFDANRLGAYFLTVSSTNNFQLRLLPEEGAGMIKTVIRGEWIKDTTAMGCFHYKQFFRNPKYQLTLKVPTKIQIRLITPDLKPQPALNVSVFARTPSGFGAEIMTSGAYTNWVQGVLTDCTTLEPGTYAIIVSTWEPTPGGFIAIVYADQSLGVFPMPPE
ncbi:cysteine proteinase, partial [Gonapodya prolifera JEL478]